MRNLRASKNANGAMFLTNRLEEREKGSRVDVSS